MSAGLESARDSLARDQYAVLATLVAGGAAPPGFDAQRLATQADALVWKRRDVVARLRPDLVAAAGPDFARLFLVYGRRHPRPAAGSWADTAAFESSLTGAGPRRRPFLRHISARALLRTPS